MKRHVAQLAHAFEDDGDESMDAVVRRFWTKTRPLSGGRGEPAVVVDLQLWSKARGIVRP
jgi:hypothetical protein